MILFQEDQGNSHHEALAVLLFGKHHSQVVLEVLLQLRRDELHWGAPLVVHSLSVRAFEKQGLHVSGGLLLLDCEHGNVQGRVPEVVFGFDVGLHAEDVVERDVGPSVARPVERSAAPAVFDVDADPSSVEIVNAQRLVLLGRNVHGVDAFGVLDEGISSGFLHQNVEHGVVAVFGGKVQGSELVGGLVVDPLLHDGPLGLLVHPRINIVLLSVLEENLKAIGGILVCRKGQQSKAQVVHHAHNFWLLLS